MAWKDNLRPASFRGVSFFVDVSQYTSGRRLAFHEFPDRDLPFAEDLGRVGRTFKLDGHVLGDDYFQLKNRLIEAAEKEGPGELIHPYFGTLQVQCGAISIDEDTKEGRIAKVSFQFYEAGDNRFPREIDDKGVKLQEASQNALDKSKAEFDRKFSIVKLAGFAVDTARNAVDAAATAFENATKDVVTLAEDAANLAFGIRNLRAEVNDLLQSPTILSQRLLDSFSLLEDAVEAPRGKFTSAFSMTLFNSPISAVPVMTPTRQREADNKETFDNFMRRAAVANAANLSASVPFESFEEATATRNQLRDLIEDILETTEDDEVFAAFKDLNAQLAETVPDVDSDLPNVQEIKLETQTSSIVLAYDLFEDPDAEEDIIARNGIRNPGFIDAGETLEVIDVRTSA